NDAEFERDAARLGVADRRGRAAIGHRHDDIGLDRRLFREIDPHLLARRVDRPAGDDRVWAGEVNVLEQADALGPRGERLYRIDGDRAIGLGLADHHFAVLDIANERRADDVERAGFRREDRLAVEVA